MRGGGGERKTPRSVKLIYNLGKVQKFKQTSYRKEASRDKTRTQKRFHYQQIS